MANPNPPILRLASSADPTLSARLRLSVPSFISALQITHATRNINYYAHVPETRADCEIFTTRSGVASWFFYTTARLLLSLFSLFGSFVARWIWQLEEIGFASASELLARFWGLGVFSLSLPKEW